MSLFVRVGFALAAAAASACGNTFCDEYPEACVSAGGSNAGGGGEGPDIDGVLQSGAILCSDCAESPFCYDMNQDPPVFVYIGANETCPGDLLPAEPAKRRAANGGVQNFFCVPPNEGDDFNVEDTWCTDTLVNHSAADECGADSDGLCMGDPCLDDNCASQHGQIVTLCGKDLASEGGPNELFASAAVAQEKIIDVAAGYHQLGIPGNANADPNNPDEEPPGRYCFVTCFDESLFTNPVSCDPADDPWVSATSTFVSIDEGSEATVTIITTDEDGEPRSTTSSVDIEGTIAIDVPRECRGLGGGETASCNVGIGSMLLRGQSELSVQGLTISDLSVINRVNWTASAEAFEDTTTVTLDAAPALVTAQVGPFGRFGLRQELSGASGVLDWNGRSYDSTIRFLDPSGSGGTILSFSGSIPNIPPRADAGRDRSFECTGDGRADVTLTAGGTDADGDEDLASFVWSREIDGHWIVSSGSTLSAPFRLGESSVILTAIDSARAKDMDGMKVTVVDSLAPEFAGIDVAPGSLWPANSRLHLFRLGHEIRPTVADACDSSPAVNIVDVSGEGDIRFGDEAICIRAASGPSNPLLQYIVTMEVVDASGNWTQQDVRITNADLAPAVADGDPRCP